MAEGRVSLQLAIIFLLVDIASFQTGTGMTMQGGAGMTMQGGAGMHMQNGAGMTMQNGAGMTMQNGAGLSLQNGANMQMQGGTGQTPDQLMIQPMQMHPHMGMQMVPHGLQNMHPGSVMQPGQSWTTMNRVAPGNVQMQGNDAAMAMGNNAGAGIPGAQNAALMGAGTNHNGQNQVQTGMPSGMQTGMPSGMQTGMQTGFQTGMQSGLQTGMQSGLQTGMPSGMPSGMPPGMPAGASAGMSPSGMSQMGVGGMSPDMQHMQGQFWPMGGFQSQNVMPGNQFAAYPYPASMTGGAAADTQVAFSMLSTPKPAVDVVTTAAPAGAKPAGSTPYPKIAYIDDPKFKNGMINWTDVADALVQIGRVLNWMVKFNYMQ